MISNGSSVLQQSAAFCRMSGGRSTGPAKEGKLFGLVGGAKADVTKSDGKSRTIVPPHRTCRSARIGCDDETRGQSAVVGLLAGARGGFDDLQAAQSAADRLIDILSDTAGTPTAMKGRGAAICQGIGRAADGRNRVRS